MKTDIVIIIICAGVMETDIVIALSRVNVVMHVWHAINK